MKKQLLTIALLFVISITFSQVGIGNTSPDAAALLDIGDAVKDKGILKVKLESVASDSSLGQVKESDSIFEIYTESYGERPLVIQGAGAGAKVTARGVFGDILRLAEKAI